MLFRSIVHRPRPEDDPRQRRPDISRAQELLGWEPKTRLKAGLERTVGYFERLLREADVRAMLLDERGISPNNLQKLNDMQA